MESRRERRRRRHARAKRWAREAATLCEVEPDGQVSPGPEFGERCPPDEESWPDLLHERPLRPVGVDLLRQSLRFAFESGDAGGALTGASERAPVAPSSFARESFEAGLFLPELVREAFVIELDGARVQPGPERLLGLLTAPSDDPADLALRQSILRELRTRSALAASLGRAYRTLRDLRHHLDEEPMGAGETVRRKVEVLSCIRALFRELAEGLEGAESPLERLQRFAQRTVEGPAFLALEEVLAFDGNFATLEVRIVLGADGTMRDFELLGARENRDNALVRPPLSRALARLWSWLRGYRYHDHAVLLSVLDRAFEGLEDALLPCFRLLGDLEFYLANLSFARRAEGMGLPVCLPEVVGAPGSDAPAGPRQLTRLWNPLLWMQRVTPTPCDLRLEGHDAVLLITGPNSGGKTRLLQAASLAQLMAQAGFFVAAAEGRLTRAPSLFVSLIEEAPADQKEGRLGTELMRVRKLFENIEPGTFVALDEICSGTNPSEGIAIFEMVLSLLPRLRPQVLLTTHFLDAARRLAEEGEIPRLCFRCVELADDATPTYQFVEGVAETSLAREVAARLGVTREELEALVEARSS